MAGPAIACGGLIAPNGAVNLVRTSTLVAYHDGVEHYVTSFEFAGDGGGKFGSIVPLPGVPSKVQKGGGWTLQRLQQEVAPPVTALRDSFAAAGSAVLNKAEVLLEKRIDALDVTILKGGGDEVGLWAKENGFALPPDSPEVLDFYAERSPIFMAAKFDVKEARSRGFGSGDGTPVHLTIPTPNPWVPLRILGLGKAADERIEADVFMLTDGVPSMLPAAGTEGSGSGLILERQEVASDLLMTDLRSDRGMGWMPPSGMWFSYVRIDTTAGELQHDLAIDQSGYGTPSPVAAGLAEPGTTLLPRETGQTALWLWAVAAGMALAMLFGTDRLVASRR
ncbi:MAG: DUF2330 domain-containing protein [Actinomycetota bacterium]|nr:DUF2330 domain-containing protein [Actinomycetota bacterium]